MMSQSGNLEVVKSRLWIKIFLLFGTILGILYTKSIIYDPFVPRGEILICFLGIIVGVLTTISYFAFRIEFSSAGQYWRLFPFVHRRYIWKGEGKKVKLVPVDYYIGIDIKIHGNLVLPGLNALFFKNIKGACRMLYLYDPNMYEEELQILRKWGKIDETEEEYYQRIIAQQEANSKKTKRKLRKQKEQEERRS